MRKMTWALILTMLAFLPAESRTQSSGASERATHDALAAEVRLLRQAVERLAAVSARSHVLVSRLAVQQQRVARAQDTVDRVAEAMRCSRPKAGTNARGPREPQRRVGQRYRGATPFSIGA